MSQIDLSEEKIYDLDIKKKTSKVTTFAELRKQMEDAKREAEKSAREERRAPGEPSKPSQQDPDEKELEVDFDVKNTGATKSIGRGAEADAGCRRRIRGAAGRVPRRQVE